MPSQPAITPAICLLLPYYVINVLRYPATTGGTLMLVTYLLTILAAPLAGKLSDRIGTARLSSLGLAVQGFGLWLVGRLNSETEYLALAVALGVVGRGLGTFEASNMSSSWARFRVASKVSPAASPA